MTERIDARHSDFSGQGSWIPGAVLLICALLWNPSLYWSFGKAGAFPLFTAGALGLISAGLLLFPAVRAELFFRRLKTWVLAAWIGFLLLILFHFVLNPRLSLTHLGMCLVWLTVPGLVCEQYSFFRKFLSGFIAFLGVFNLLYCLTAYCVRGIGFWEPGITGNVNWTAALVVMSTPFQLIFCRKLESRGRFPWLSVLAVMVNAAVLLRIGSKGAVCAAVLTGLVYGWLRASGKWRKLLCGIVLAAMLGGGFWLTRNTDAVSRFMMDDGRVMLYEGAVSLIAEYPLFGTGQAGFENEFMRHRPLEYFSILNPAARSNHPHSHLLYIAGSWGIFGLICWGFLLFAPLWQAARKLYRRETLPPLTVQCFLTVLYAFFHGSLDLIWISWPTYLIALLCLGMLWHEFLLNPEPERVRVPPLRKILAPAAGAALMVCGIVVAGQSAWAACSVQRLYSVPMTAVEQAEIIRRMARWCPADYQANFAVLRLLEKRIRKPELSVLVADAMLKSNIPNYPGLHMGRANALMRLGRFQEAIADYQTEAELFPLTLRPVYNMVVAARMMRDFPQAARYEEELQRRMKLRGVDSAMLRKILTGDSKYDLRIREIPQ